MTKPAWHWHPASVGGNRDHFELRYGQPESPANSWKPIALIGRPTQGMFPVEFFVDSTSETYSSAISAVIRELDFYLVEKGERDPWAYARYHCGTASNLYSFVHWFFCPEKRQLAEPEVTAN